LRTQYSTILAWLFKISVFLKIKRTLREKSKQAGNLIFMNVEEQIQDYIASQPEPKRSEMRELHQRILQVLPGRKLWFEDGKNSENKTVANPNIGYGAYTIKYADGKNREFFQIGISANTTGISV